MDATHGKVFIGYSRKDIKWLERLQVHLKPLEREGLICLWDDTRIQAGAISREEVERALAEAVVAVFLISADFLASDFTHDVALPVLLHRAELGGVRMLPLIVGASLFETSPLAVFRPVNAAKKPLNSLTVAQQEETLAEAARAVMDAIHGKRTLPVKEEAPKAKPEGDPPSSPIPHLHISSILKIAILVGSMPIALCGYLVLNKYSHAPSPKPQPIVDMTALAAVERTLPLLSSPTQHPTKPGKHPSRPRSQILGGDAECESRICRLLGISVVELKRTQEKQQRAICLDAKDPSSARMGIQAKCTIISDGEPPQCQRLDSMSDKPLVSPRWRLCDVE